MIHAGIKSERPSPIDRTGRYAGAHANGPHADIGEVDGPGLFMRIVGAAAGEGGIIRRGERIGARARRRGLRIAPKSTAQAFGQ